MGFRYRKSVKFGPVRFTASKSGISTSVGVKGFRVTKTANGRVRTTTSIPGTGISYVKESSSKRQTRRPASRSASPVKSVKHHSAGGMIAKIALGALFVFAGFSSPDGGWSVGYFLTALVIGGALIAWGLVPYLSEKKQAQIDSIREEELLLEKENEPKKCSSCGATSSGKFCEYCGSKMI